MNTMTGDKPDDQETTGKDTAQTPVSSESPDKPKSEPDPAGLDPTRFGDWEKNGRCIDF